MARIHGESGDIRSKRGTWAVALAVGLFALGCQKNGGASAAKAVNDVVKAGQKIGEAVNKVDDAATKVADAANKTSDAVTAVSHTVDVAQTAMQGPARGADNGLPPPEGRTAMAAAHVEVGAQDGSTASGGGSGGGGSSSASAFAGTYNCAGTADLVPQVGRPVHWQGPGPRIVVDNGDGTISIVDPNNKDQCPPGRWVVSGSTAKAVTDQPCHKPDGTVVRVIRGDANLSGRGLTADGAVVAVGNNNVLQVTYSLRCGR